MTNAMTPRRFGSHDNNFGLLRLVFAWLVIVSHVPAMVYGNSDHDLLMRLFGSASLGDVAVGGFFVISGFLIPQSYLASRTSVSYLIRRIARIFPAFALSSLFCLFLVAPLAGGVPIRTGQDMAEHLVRIVFLRAPWVPGAFAGTPYPDLNGCAWTIAYEFRCYLLVIAAGMAGILRRSTLLMIVAVALLLVNAVLEWGGGPGHVPRALDYVIGRPIELTRLLGLFCAGAAFIGLRDRLPMTRRMAVIALVGFATCLCWRATAFLGIATCGAYLILFAAQAAPGSVLRHVNNRNDISYGVYLYAWPIGKLILWWAPALPLLLTGLTTWAMASVCGALSWFLVEKPIMERVRSRRHTATASAL